MTEMEVKTGSGPIVKDEEANMTIVGQGQLEVPPPPRKKKKDAGGDDDPNKSSMLTSGFSVTKARVGSLEPVITTLAVDNENHFPWTNTLETAFFKCLMKHKPIGIHKNFRMLLAAHEFKKAVGMEEVDIDYLWKHVAAKFCIEELENIERADDMDVADVDFELPEKEFGELIRDLKNKDEDEDGKVKDKVKVKDKDKDEGKGKESRPLSPPIAVTSAGVRRTILKATKTISKK